MYKTKTRLSSNDSTNAPDLERVRSITEVNLRLKILVQRYIFKISLFETSVIENYLINHFYDV